MYLTFKRVRNYAYMAWHSTLNVWNVSLHRKTGAKRWLCPFRLARTPHSFWKVPALFVGALLPRICTTTEPKTIRKFIALLCASAFNFLWNVSIHWYECDKALRCSSLMGDSTELYFFHAYLDSYQFLLLQANTTSSMSIEIKTCHGQLYGWIWEKIRTICTYSTLQKASFWFNWWNFGSISSETTCTLRSLLNELARLIPIDRY